MYFIYHVLLFFYLICGTKSRTEAYFAPVCSKNGGVCGDRFMAYAAGLNAENLISLEQVSESLSKAFSLLRPPRKICAFVISSVLDVIRNVLQLGQLLQSPPPPPPTFLERIVRVPFTISVYLSVWAILLYQFEYDLPVRPLGLCKREVILSSAILLRLVGWKGEEENQLVVGFNPGLTVYLLLIGCTVWMFVYSFYSKSTYKKDFDWHMKRGFIFDSSLSENAMYRRLCNECICKRRK